MRIEIRITIEGEKKPTKSSEEENWLVEENSGEENKIFIDSTSFKEEDWKELNKFFEEF